MIGFTNEIRACAGLPLWSGVIGRLDNKRSSNLRRGADLFLWNLSGHLPLVSVDESFRRQSRVAVEFGVSLLVKYDFSE